MFNNVLLIVGIAAILFLFVVAMKRASDAVPERPTPPPVPPVPRGFVRASRTPDETPPTTPAKPAEEGGSFLASAAIGYATDNGLLGGIAGGDLIGGIVGEMLNDED